MGNGSACGTIGVPGLLDAAFDPAPVRDTWHRQPLTPKIEAALWAFQRGTYFPAVVRLDATLGGDADTTAAVAGQIAGTVFGVQGIPERWLGILAMRSR